MPAISHAFKFQLVMGEVHKNEEYEHLIFPPDIAESEINIVSGTTLLRVDENGTGNNEIIFR